MSANDFIGSAIKEEQRRAAQNQRRAGLAAVCRTGFRRDLPEIMEKALQRLWDLGNLGDGKRDETMGRLYIMLGKGLVSVTSADVIRLAGMPDGEIRARAGESVSGKGLER